MVILIKAAQFFLSLSILIILHEFGHFIFAKVFKCRVEKFYLFFNLGFSLFKTKRGETEYGIGWLPLGGYVKISGMIDESMDKEQMKQPPQPWEFRSKPTHQRLLIMVGGVLMNFIAALLIYIMVLYVWGKQYLPTSSVKYGVEVSDIGRQVGFENGDYILSVDNNYIENFGEIVPTILLNRAKTVQVLRDSQKVNVEISNEDIALMIQANKRSKKQPDLILSYRIPFELTVKGFAKDSPAEAAGIQKGDKITRINGQQFAYHDEYASVLKQNKGNTVVVTYLRNNIESDTTVVLNELGMLGVTMDRSLIDEFEFKTIRYGFFASIPAGIQQGWDTSVDYLKQFRLIFDRKTKAYESLGGFITIGNIFPGKWNWHAFWDMTAFLSIILGIMNILPIPALDGGHVMFVLYEMITGRKPNEKFLEYAQMIGLSLLLLLVLYANANDVIRLFK